jgi:ABC-2 type transport system ATP-binding protein
MPDSLLTIRDARKSFGATAALQGASLALEPGELLGLLGPNGAGKTTLVRAVAGRVRLDSGTVGVDPQSRERIYEMLAALRKGGTSLLLTTHQLDEAEALCDRIVVIDHGRVIAAGSLAQLVASTVGEGRRVTLTVDRAPARPLATLAADAAGTTLSADVRDVAAELPELLQQAAAAGVVVKDVAVKSPSLHAVFIHLTGSELRE